MDLMIYPGSPVKLANVDGVMVKKGEKVTVSEAKGEKMLAIVKFNRPLWVEYMEEYASPPIEVVEPIKEDNSDGKTTGTSDKED